jgi:hypothetical protein
MNRNILPQSTPTRSVCEETQLPRTPTEASARQPHEPDAQASRLTPHLCLQEALTSHRYD